MKQLLIMFFIGIFLIIANEGFAAEKKSTWVFDYKTDPWQRPANFYRLAEYTDKPFCEKILNKLNEPYTASDHYSYFNLLTQNSASLIWKYISDGPVYMTEYSNEKKLYIYKRYGAAAGAYLSRIVITDTPIPMSGKDKDFILNKYTDKDFYIERMKKQNMKEIVDSEINFLSLGEKENLVVLSGEGAMEHVCGGYFHLYAQSYSDVAVDTKPNNLCHFISNPKIKCIWP